MRMDDSTNMCQVFNSPGMGDLLQVCSDKMLKAGDLSWHQSPASLRGFMVKRSINGFELH